VETTNINSVLQEFNNIHHDIQYTMEDERNNKIQFLHITIHRFERELTYDIYIKPTTTDTMIHQTSCHPTQHKVSGINYLINRLNTYPFEESGKKKEKDIIRQMLKQNNYSENAHISQKLINKYIKTNTKT
jgi:hypothetical protein